MNLAEAERVRNEAAGSLMTLAAFVGSGGKSVKIVVPFTLPDGTLPQNAEEAKYFHAHAYRKAVDHYHMQLSKKIEIKEPGVNRCCRLGFDPEAYYNPDAVPVCMVQPVGMPGELTYFEEREKEENPLGRMMPGWKRNSGSFASLGRARLYPRTGRHRSLQQSGMEKFVLYLDVEHGGSLATTRSPVCK